MLWSSLLLAVAVLAQAVEPPPLPEPKTSVSTETTQEPSPTDPLILRYQDCIQKLIDAPQADQNFMRKCLGIDARGGKNTASGQRRLLSQEDVSRVASRGLASLSTCYEPIASEAQSLGIAAPEGRVEVLFDIDAAGVASNLSFVATTLNDMRFLQCLREQVSVWRYPKTALTNVAKVQLGFDVVANVRRKGAHVRVAAGYPKLSGEDFSFAPEDLLSVFRTNAASVRQCYDQLLVRQPSAAGKVTSEITVDSSGKVKRVRFRLLTITEQGFKACLTRAIMRWRFPSPPSGEETRAKYPPWTFAPQTQIKGQ